MMLHRHFETEPSENMTTHAVLQGEKKEEFVSEIFPPEEEKPKRGRKKKNEE